MNILTLHISLDEEDMKTMEGNKKTEETEPLEEEKSNPVDDKSDKTLILQEG